MPFLHHRVYIFIQICLCIHIHVSDDRSITRYVIPHIKVYVAHRALDENTRIVPIILLAFQKINYCE